MRRDVRCELAALAFTICAVPRIAHATDGVIPARLAWVRDDSAQSCPDALQMEARLRARLDADPFQGAPRRLIEAIVRRGDGLFTAHIATRSVDGTLLGTRDINSASADCSGLANAAIVTMAMSLTIGDESVDNDDDASASSASPESSSPAPRTTDSSRGDAAAETRGTTLSPLHLVLDGEHPPVFQHAPPPPAIATSVHATANMVFHGGILPLLGVGVSLQFDARIHHYARVGVGLAWLPDQALHNGTTQYDFGMTAGHADLCVDVLGSSPHTFALCAGVWAGGIHAVVYDLQPVSPGLTPWVGVSNSVRVSFALGGPVEIQFEAGGMLNVTRYHFVRAEGPAVFVQSPVGVIGRVGLGVRFR